MKGDNYKTMDLTNLDLDTVRTLIVANDLGGYRQAAKRLSRTPSAISLQMKRLQENIGELCFAKTEEGRRSQRPEKSPFTMDGGCSHSMTSCWTPSMARA